MKSADDDGLSNLMSRRAAVLRFLLIASGVARDPVIILTFLSSLSRAAIERKI